MTYDETLDVLTIVAARWPRADLGRPDIAAKEWLATLAPYEMADVESAVNRWHGSGKDFPPNSGQVKREIELALQVDPPSFDDLQLWLQRNIRLLPYGQTNQPGDTPAAIAALEAAGAHEALLRFVAAHGVYAVRNMPDPGFAALDPNQLADRRDFARDYGQRVLPAWRSDPRPGLALERACRPLALEPGEVRELASGHARRQLERRAALALPAGQAEDEPMMQINPAELLADFRRRRSEARAAEQARVKAERALDLEERRATERELAEHAARRSVVA